MIYNIWHIFNMMFFLCIYWCSKYSICIYIYLRTMCKCMCVYAGARVRLYACVCVCVFDIRNMCMSQSWEFALIQWPHPWLKVFSTAGVSPSKQEFPEKRNETRKIERIPAYRTSLCKQEWGEKEHRTSEHRTSFTYRTSFCKQEWEKKGYKYVLGSGSRNGGGRGEGRAVALMQVYEVCCATDPRPRSPS